MERTAIVDHVILLGSIDNLDSYDAVIVVVRILKALMNTLSLCKGDLFALEVLLILGLQVLNRFLHSCIELLPLGRRVRDTFRVYLVSLKKIADALELLPICLAGLGQLICMQKIRDVILNGGGPDEFKIYHSGVRDE